MQSTLSKYQVNGSEAGIKIVKRNINNLRYLYGITEKKLDNEEEIKSLLMRM